MASDEGQVRTDTMISKLFVWQFLNFYWSFPRWSTDPPWLYIKYTMLCSVWSQDHCSWREDWHEKAHSVKQHKHCCRHQSTAAWRTHRDEQACQQNCIWGLKEPSGTGSCHHWSRIPLWFQREQDVWCGGQRMANHYASNRHLTARCCVQQSQWMNSLFLTTDSQGNKAPLSNHALKHYQQTEREEVVMFSLKQLVSEWIFCIQRALNTKIKISLSWRAQLCEKEGQAIFIFYADICVMMINIALPLLCPSCLLPGFLHLSNVRLVQLALGSHFDPACLLQKQKAQNIPQQGFLTICLSFISFVLPVFSLP